MYKRNFSEVHIYKEYINLKQALTTNHKNDKALDVGCCVYIIIVKKVAVSIIHQQSPSVDQSSRDQSQNCLPISKCCLKEMISTTKWDNDIIEPILSGIIC